MATDRAVGAIPVCRVEGRLLFCLVKLYDGRWSFPKGHQDEDESDIDTVRRELREETGISEVRLDTSRLFSEQYQFEKNGMRYDKTVDYFVAFAETTSNTTPEQFRSEVLEMRWLSYERALDMIREQSKPLLVQAHAYLESRA